ncbi:AzlD domain-containing protein [Sulfitobacter sp. M57]|uniref:AzlD domain-containing protein n=1 Tax=unclassified Sulfitobacter TaxID=196795 RepID=UPI0023E09BC5|nr:MULTISPECIES: AzlD domain-containing protein [unclassified Sulfitobacter]MDF3415554.1 AzlD domain-containing protein [Sulfitobacter sp. KE5]MDF3423035.1 AzlD domain-containing protein [Sulfitobacter sp. KE43]MDF3434100.1 AzlD domain-containing protein [Sulfitobacter sp. KE42]MDF3459867.1 AzlD domain-containing protein [Sulfitobacter sp. S74]MDF3463639.1 AzlD domain-containing protein [Sulfitobacter sp. Ks18]
MIDKTTLWIVIIGLGVGSFLLRFAFTGFVGDREMPAWLLRHLRYTAVAVLPALIAPQVLWPSATGGETDPARLAAAAAALAVGLLTKNVLGAMLAGGFTLYGMLYLLG